MSFKPVPAAKRQLGAHLLGSQSAHFWGGGGAWEGVGVTILWCHVLVRTPSCHNTWRRQRMTPPTPHPPKEETCPYIMGSRVQQRCTHKLVYC